MSLVLEAVRHECLFMSIHSTRLFMGNKKNSEGLTFWLTPLLNCCDGYLPIRPDTVRYLFNVGCAVPCFPIRLGAPTFKGFREHHHSLLCLI